MVEINIEYPDSMGAADRDNGDRELTVTKGDDRVRILFNAEQAKDLFDWDVPGPRPDDFYSQN